MYVIVLDIGRINAFTILTLEVRTYDIFIWNNATDSIGEHVNFNVYEKPR